ncbi:MAG: hypothetical protein D6719_00275 [Candidatus Dadabacteria bacterium]|nr:MAG: hypothetical protein D6719_00275 [Candidatus Dadabacteria bacterium]
MIKNRDRQPAKDFESFKKELNDSIAKIKQVNPEHNIFLEIESYNDEMLFKFWESQRGSCLFGLTFAAKDVFARQNRPLTLGVKPAAIESANETARAIEQLMQRGAIFLGATNLDPLALGVFGRNEFYGDVSLPDESGRVVMGSSSGSAAAVAAGLVSFALASDYGGSTRIPAAACKICGLRSNRISDRGMFKLSKSSDAPGILTLDLRTLKTVLKGLDIQVENSSRMIAAIPAGFAGFIKDFELKNMFYSATDRIARKRKLTEIVLPFNLDDLAAIRKTIAVAEVAETFKDLNLKTQQLTNQARAIMRAFQVQKEGMLQEAKDALDKIGKQLNGLLNGSIALLTPSCPCALPSAGRTAAHISVELLEKFMIMANLFDLPSLTFSVADVSLTLTGSAGTEGELIALALEIEEILTASV